jgi:putative transposase
MIARRVEQRFRDIRAPHGAMVIGQSTLVGRSKSPWRSIWRPTIPVGSPESNGMAEAFVKTFQRDYVRVSPISNAAEALSLIDLDRRQ